MNGARFPGGISPFLVCTLDFTGSPIWGMEIEM